MAKKLWLLLSRFDWLFLLILLFFSSILMSKTLGATPDGNIKIAIKAWSDFAATIPLIRSFSFGDNFPPEYPIYPGPPIRYHFVFFALVGFFEALGVPFYLVFNFFSSLFFFLLLAAIYFAGKVIFKNRGVGVLSVVLFLFNGSFAFIEFFKKNPLSLNSLSQILSNTDFSSFGPYDGKIVSAFWNLNIYTNQRHLALAYFGFLALLVFVYLASQKPKILSINKSLLLGLIIGLFPFVHLSVFMMSGISLLVFFLIYPTIRKQVFIIGFIALLLAIPQFLYMGPSETKTELFRPGYLVSPLTLQSFFNYWFLNIGISVLIAPIGFFIASKEQRKILIPFLAFFVIGNLFQFTPDMPTNHKFFNLSVIGLNLFTAFLIVKVWSKNIVSKIFSVIIIVTLTLSGFIDLFPIFNDRHIVLEDIPNDKTATFIKKSTPKDAIFLNSQFLYDPASLAGRKIYLGWPYFAWSAGYDTTGRFEKMRTMLESPSKINLCSYLRREGVDYIEIKKDVKLEDIKTDYEFFDRYNPIYVNAATNTAIYDSKVFCK